jgi:hypothetical protein
MAANIKTLSDYKLAEVLLGHLEIANISGNFAEAVREAANRLQKPKTGYVNNPEF